MSDRRSGHDNAELPGIEATIERIRQLNERILELGQHAGLAYLDAYQRTLEAVAAIQEETVGSDPVQYLTSLAQAQANFVSEVGRQFTSALV